jgi:hypothetical protein
VLKNSSTRTEKWARSPIHAQQVGFERLEGGPELVTVVKPTFSTACPIPGTVLFG